MKILLKRHEMFMVPLKDLVVFPRMIVPLFVGRRRSLRSVEEAMRLGRALFLVAQRKTGVEEPDERDVHDVGTVSRVLQMLKLPDGKIRLLVEGLERAVITKYSETRDSFRVIVRPLPETTDVTPQMSALMRTALSQFTRYAEVSKKVPPEAVTAVE
ncbi:MAG TPA: LON peptidase substrate-binding domain-containing protein, partial [Spirochaetia bacterium]|nr:LON peptidase substrate-binding domain-containing protein [Spirochaetia bacterium]